TAGVRECACGDRTAAREMGEVRSHAASRRAAAHGVAEDAAPGEEHLLPLLLERGGGRSARAQLTLVPGRKPPRRFGDHPKIHASVLQPAELGAAAVIDPGPIRT